MNFTNKICLNLVAFLVSSLIILLVFSFFGNFTARDSSAELSAAATADLTISTAQDFIDFAAAVNGGDTFEGKTVLLASNIDLSARDFREYHIKSEFAGSFVGEDGTYAYKISGVKITDTDFIFTKNALGLFNYVSGSISGVLLDAEVLVSADIDTPLTAGYVGPLVGFLSGSINNCAVKTLFSNTTNLNFNFSGLCGRFSKNASINNIYVDILLDEASFWAGLKLYKIGYGTAMSSGSFTAVFGNDAVSNGTLQIFAITPTADDEFWTIINNEPTLNIFIKNENAPTGGDGGSDSGETGEGSGETGDGSGETGGDTGEIVTKTDIMPKLVKSTFTYNASVPTLEVYFEGTSDEVAYTLSEITATSVGKYEAQVSIIDTNKYNLLADVVTFEIKPYRLNVTWGETALTYNGAAQAPAFHFVAPSFAPDLALEYEHKYTLAGNYTAKLVTPANFTLSKPTCDFVINKYEIAISWTDTDLIYNGKSQCPKPNFSLPSFASALEIICGGHQINAGSENYIAFAQLNESDKANFSLINATCPFEIKKKNVKITWNDVTEFTFNNEPQYPKFYFSCPNSTTIENFYAVVTGDESHSVVGDYLIKVCTRDKVNFSIENATFSYQIVPYVLTANWSTSEFEYNGQVQFPQFNMTFPSFYPEDAEIDKINGKKDAGKYTAQLFCTNTNFIIKNPTCAYEIKPLIVNVACKNEILEYNGTAQIPQIDFSAPDFEDFELIVRGANTNVGADYYVVLDYICANKNNFRLSVSKIDYEIIPYTIAVEWSAEPIIYSSYECAPKYKITLPEFATGLMFNYSQKARDVGEYSTELLITNDIHGNFALSGEKTTFSIIPDTVKVKWSKDNFVYNGKVQFPEFSFDKNYVKDSDFTLNNNTINCGEYVAKIENKSKNFIIENPTFDYTIAQYEICINWRDSVLNYTGNPQKPVVMYTKTDFMTDIKIEVMGAQINAGEHTAAAVLLGENSANFVLKNATQKFTILPKVITITWLNLIDTFDGKNHSPTFALGESIDDLKIVCREYRFAGEYEVTLTCENANYTLQNHVAKYTILPKEISVIWGESKFTYNGLPQCVTAEFGMVPLKITGAESEAGEHTALCVSEDPNYVVDNPTHAYTIEKCEITVRWAEAEFVYNNTPQAPTASYALPDFANPGDFVQIGLAINAGLNYCTQIVTQNNNYKIRGGACNFAIKPRKIEILWQNDEYFYNGQFQKPAFEYAKDEFNQDLSIEMRNFGSDVGDYTATLYLADSNFTLINNSHTYSIKPFTLEASWGAAQFVYDNSPKAPEVRVSLPDFANSAKVVQGVRGINAGTYLAIAKIYQNGAESKNFTLLNSSQIFVIKPHALTLDWGETSFCYDGEPKIPSAQIADRITFATLPRVSVSGAATLVGGYTATASLNTPNFILQNPTCEFVIMPRAVEYSGDNMLLKITINDEQILQEIEITEADKSALNMPQDLNFLFGVKISLTDDMDLNSSGAYFVQLKFDDDFILPENAYLYLLNDSCTKLDLNYSGNVLSFTTNKLGTICFAETIEKNEILRNIVGCTSLAIVAVGSVVWARVIKRARRRKFVI